MLETASVSSEITSSNMARGSWPLATYDATPSLPRTTFADAQGLSPTATETAVDGRLPLATPWAAGHSATPTETATVIQLWEGTVQEALPDEDSFRALLHAKMDGVPDHFAEIAMEWVSTQDRDLVEAGAVFYLSIFKVRRVGGSIWNSQELRFRRLPTWTKKEVASIKEMAEGLLAKGKMNPEAP